MKFLHTSDIHLGAKFENLGAAARDQREQLRKTFSKVVDLAIEQKVDLFLVAGDLFDSNHPSAKSIEFAKNEFLRLAQEGIKVCLIPGNHDYKLSDKKDLGKHFSKLAEQGIFLFTDPEGSKTYFEDIDTEVYAKANTTNKSSESPMVKVDDQRKAEKIIMAHGGVVGQAKDPQFPIQPKEIEESGANYVALGDWHSMRDESRGDVVAFYSGSPEILNISQTGAGYVIIGTIDYGVVNTEQRQVGAKEAKEIELNLEEFENLQALKDAINKQANEGLILTVKLVGNNINKIILDTDELERELGDEFWRLRIQNNTHLPIEEFDDSDYPSVLISGQFLQIMKEKINNAQSEEERELYQEALKTGLQAFHDPDVIR
ncbi:MAG: DNA repair exonuclease [Candidatus Spechtbacterales bacterium]|nr:DNA repair exonuclease [Candidatus Spechtbacterales bacterium]